MCMIKCFCSGACQCGIKMCMWKCFFTLLRSRTMQMWRYLVQTPPAWSGIRHSHGTNPACDAASEHPQGPPNPFQVLPPLGEDGDFQKLDYSGVGADVTSFSCSSSLAVWLRNPPSPKRKWQYGECCKSTLWKCFCTYVHVHVFLISVFIKCLINAHG